MIDAICHAQPHVEKRKPFVVARNFRGLLGIYDESGQGLQPVIAKWTETTGNEEIYMEKSVAIGDLAWPEYARRVREDGQSILIPIGALEQHGPHMSMNPDVLLPSAISVSVAKKIGALVAPP